MGLKRRFQNLLRGTAANRSASQTRCQRHCCHQQCNASAAAAEHNHHNDHHPQLGRRGPVADSAMQISHQQQHQQKLRDRQLSHSCERRRGNHYASFSTTVSASSTGTSSSSTSSSSNIQQQKNLWRPINQLNNFVRLEAAESSCYVAELSSSFSASSRLSAASSAGGCGGSVGSGPVYEEINPDEPLYDRVATCADPDEANSDEFCGISRYWLYSSLPRQHRRRERLSRDPGPLGQLPPTSSFATATAASATDGQCLPLGLTHVDWRGVKCTSF